MNEEIEYQEHMVHQLLERYGNLLLAQSELTARLSEVNNEVEKTLQELQKESKRLAEMKKYQQQ